MPLKIAATYFVVRKCRYREAIPYTHPGCEVFWTWWNLAWDRVDTDRMSERLDGYTYGQYDLDAIVPRRTPCLEPK